MFGKRGPKISANRRPRYCPGCGGLMVKAGVPIGKQLWQCRSCHRRTRYPELVPVNLAINK